MLQYEELRLKLEGLKPEIDDLANALRLEQCRRDLDGLEIKASEQGFWDNMESAQAVLQKIPGLKETISRYEKLVADYDHLNIKVAVMGCVVNGPGEAKEADLGIAGGKGCGILIKKGQIIKKIDEKDILSTLKYELDNWSE